MVRVCPPPPRLHKIKQLSIQVLCSTFVISKTWPGDRAPDGREVSDSSMAVWMKWGNSMQHDSAALGETCYPSRNQYCKSAVVKEMLVTKMLSSLLTQRVWPLRFFVRMAKSHSLDQIQASMQMCISKWNTDVLEEVRIL